MRSIPWDCDPQQTLLPQLQPLLSVRLGAGHQEGRAGFLLSKRPECRGAIQDRVTGTRRDNCTAQRVGRDYLWLGLAQVRGVVLLLNNEKG